MSSSGLCEVERAPTDIGSWASSSVDSGERATVVRFAEVRSAARRIERRIVVTPKTRVTCWSSRNSVARSAATGGNILGLRLGCHSPMEHSTPERRRSP